MFKSGKALLEPSSNKVLDQLIALLSAYPTNRVLVEGQYRQTRAVRNLNLQLSELRAKASGLSHQTGRLRRRSIPDHGLRRYEAGRRHSTKEGRTINRRVEVTILKSGKPMTGRPTEWDFFNPSFPAR